MVYGVKADYRQIAAEITPEYWIDYFYRLLDYGADVTTVDNTELTPQQTAGVILADFFQI